MGNDERLQALYTLERGPFRCRKAKSQLDRDKRRDKQIEERKTARLDLLEAEAKLAKARSLPTSASDRDKKIIEAEAEKEKAKGKVGKSGSYSDEKDTKCSPTNLNACTSTAYIDIGTRMLVTRKSDATSSLASTSAGFSLGVFYKSPWIDASLDLLARPTGADNELLRDEPGFFVTNPDAAPLALHLTHRWTPTATSGGLRYSYKRFASFLFGYSRVLIGFPTWLYSDDGDDPSASEQDALDTSAGSLSWGIGPTIGYSSQYAEGIKIVNRNGTLTKRNEDGETSKISIGELDFFVGLRLIGGRHFFGDIFKSIGNRSWLDTVFPDQRPRAGYFTQGVDLTARLSPVEFSFSFDNTFIEWRDGKIQRRKHRVLGIDGLQGSFRIKVAAPVAIYQEAEKSEDTEQLKNEIVELSQTVRLKSEAALSMLEILDNSAKSSIKEQKASIETLTAAGDTKASEVTKIQLRTYDLRDNLEEEKRKMEKAREDAKSATATALDSSDTKELEAAKTLVVEAGQRLAEAEEKTEALQQEYEAIKNATTALIDDAPPEDGSASEETETAEDSSQTPDEGVEKAEEPSDTVISTGGEEPDGARNGGSGGEEEEPAESQTGDDSDDE